MAELRLDQQRALALAAARKRVAEQDEFGPSSGPRFPGHIEPVEEGPWTKYRHSGVTKEQARDELNRRHGTAVSFDDLIPGKPSLSFDDLIPQSTGTGVTKEQAQAELDRRRRLRGTAREFEITAPDGKKYRVTGDSEDGAVNALKKHLSGSSEAAAPYHPEFDASSMPGYDPTTGMVDRGKSDSGVLAGLSSAIEGIPIVGPYLQSGSEHAAAGIGSALTGDPYERVHREMSSRVDTSQEANPITSTAAGIGGSVAGTIPMMLAAPAAFGVGAGGLAARSAASAITGAGIGGSDAAVRSGGDPESIGYGTGMGLVAGAAGPGVGALIGKGYRATADYISRRGAARFGGMTPQAIGQLVKAMEADGIPANEIQHRLAAIGPNGMLADLGANLQQTAAGLVAKPGPARGIVQDAMRTRDAGANARITGALDETLGRAPVPSQIDASIRGNQRALSPAYEAAFANARRVETQPIAEALESQMVNLRGAGQQAAREVRDMLNIAGTGEFDPNPYTLFQIRRAIDGRLAGETNSDVTRVLSQARQQVDDELARAVPGVKAVDAQYAELARQREGLERGQTVLDSGRASPRPQELADEVSAAAQPQGQMIGPSAVPLRLSQGARAEIDRIVGTNANDRAALARIVKGEGDWNPQRLATLFGPEKTQRIMQVLEAERLFAETSNFVTRNSATAARQEAVRDLTGEAGGGFGVREGYMAGGTFGAARSAAVTAAERIAHALRGAGRNADHAALARGLTSNKHAEIAKALMRGSRSSQGASEAISNVAQALMLGPATTSAEAISNVARALMPWLPTTSRGR